MVVMKKQHSGFTLIELVLVIVILGILAATALPRFVDLSSDARTAAVNGLTGSLRSAAALAHATQLAKGYSAGQSISMDGVTVSMVFGYPTTATISNALQDYTGFTNTVAGTFNASGGTAGQCTASYAQPTVANTAPAISANTTAC